MDTSILWKLSYGMYAIGTLDGSRPTGCIVNTVVQVTSELPTIAVSMNKENFTYEAIKKTGRFAVSILSERTTQNVIAKLGFSSGRNTDKFAGNIFAWELYEGLPIIKENAAGYMVAKVLAMHELESHYVILARVENTLAGVDYTPMTYKYYHEVIKGKAPKNAPTYQEQVQGQDKWICGVCGYIYEGDLLQESDDFICPICGQPKQSFKKQ
jgi:flavin reductase (DIM6/NTAB) family NADH-FMN oxidoreductase RutF/rubredoxin